MNALSLGLHLYASRDDLPRELQDHVEAVPGSSLHVFKHPLWVDLMPLATPRPIAEILRLKHAKSEEMLDADDFDGFVFLHERAYRMDALNDLWVSGAFDAIPQTYWRLARKVWIDSEQDEDDLRWDRLLEVPLPGREALSTADEWKALAKQPETLTLYRGVHGHDYDGARQSCSVGWSWTLSEKTARFFARRLLMNGHQGFVAQARAPRSAVIAHFLSRGEAEVVISFDDIDADSISILEI